MENSFRVRPYLGNLCFSSPRSPSLGFSSSFMMFAVSMQASSTQKDIRPRFWCHKHYRTLVATTWCHWMSQIWCLPAPQGIHRWFVLFPHHPGSALPKYPLHSLLSSDFFPWAQDQTPGPRQSCTGWGASFPSHVPQPSEPGTCALRPRQGLREEQALGRLSVRPRMGVTACCSTSTKWNCFFQRVY